MHKNQTFTLSLPPTVNVAKPICKACVPIHATAKQIELESPGRTGFLAQFVEKLCTCIIYVNTSLVFIDTRARVV